MPLQSQGLGGARPEWLNLLIRGALAWSVSVGRHRRRGLCASALQSEIVSEVLVWTWVAWVLVTVLIVWALGTVLW